MDGSILYFAEDNQLETFRMGHVKKSLLKKPHCKNGLQEPSGFLYAMNMWTIESEDTKIITVSIDRNIPHFSLTQSAYF